MVTQDLLAPLQNEDPRERIKALKSIQTPAGNTPLNPEILAKIKDLIRNDPSSLVKIKALEALNRVTGKAEIEFYGEIVTGKFRPSIRLKAVSILKKIENADAVQFLVAAIKEDKTNNQIIQMQAEDAIEAIIQQTINPISLPENDWEIEDEWDIELTEKQIEKFRSPEALAIGRALTSEASRSLEDPYTFEENSEWYTSQIDNEKLGFYRSWLFREIGLLRYEPGAKLLLNSMGESDQNVKIAAITAYARIRSSRAVPQLKAILENEPVPNIRLSIIDLLGKMKSDIGIPLLVDRALFDSTDIVRDASIVALEGNTNWKAKALAFEERFQQHPEITRSSINAPAVIRAIEPSFADTKADPNILPKYWLDEWKARIDDINLSAKFALLFNESCNQDQARAGHILNEYLERNRSDFNTDDARNARDRLRKLVGGETALDPLVEELNQKLREEFILPMLELRATTRTHWDKLVQRAEEGYETRFALSIVIFFMGLGLIIIFGIQLTSATSPQKLATSPAKAEVTSVPGTEEVGTPEPSPNDVNSGDLAAQAPQTTDQNITLGELIVGKGLPFLTGVIMVVLSIYSGVMRGISQSVREVSITNASFLSMLHTLTMVSQIYSYIYLKEEIKADNLDKLVSLVEQARKSSDGVKDAFESNPNDSMADVLDKLAALLKTDG